MPPARPTTMALPGRSSLRPWPLRCYLVCLECDLLLTLSYYERGKRWTAAEVGGG
jgi:hypothetical protein